MTNEHRLDRGRHCHLESALNSTARLLAQIDCATIDCQSSVQLESTFISNLTRVSLYTSPCAILRRLGVDTIVIVGAWTDFCVTATALAAVDTWGLDVVTVRDAVASAITKSPSAWDVLNVFSMVMDAVQLVSFFEAQPELIAPPAGATASMSATGAATGIAVSTAGVPPETTAGTQRLRAIFMNTNVTLALVVLALALGIVIGMLSLLAFVWKRHGAEGRRRLSEGWTVRTPVHAVRAVHPSELTNKLTS